MPNVVGTSAGYGQFTGGHFNGEAWSTVLNWKFYAQSIFRSITNTRWSGELVHGGTVNIRERPDTTSTPYQRGAKIVYPFLTDSKQQLKTDQADIIAIAIDEVDLHQTNVDIMKELAFDAAEVSANTIDKNVLGNVYPSAASTIIQTVVDKILVLEWISHAWRLLSERNVPKKGRWIALPPNITEKISIGDLKNASTTNKSSTIVDGIAENGRLAIKISGFDVYESNNLAVTNGVTNCMAGHNSAITFASSFNKSKKIDLAETVGTAIQALNVYGYLVNKPDALVHMPATV